jgi:hypothetical protein
MQINHPQNQYERTYAYSLGLPLLSAQKGCLKTPLGRAEGIPAGKLLGVHHLNQYGAPSVRLLWNNPKQILKRPPAA